MTFSTYTR